MKYEIENRDLLGKGLDLNDYIGENLAEKTLDFFHCLLSNKVSKDIKFVPLKGEDGRRAIHIINGTSEYFVYVNKLDESKKEG